MVVRRLLAGLGSGSLVSLSAASLLFDVFVPFDPGTVCVLGTVLPVPEGT